MDRMTEIDRSQAGEFAPRTGFPIGCFKRMKILVIDDEPANVALLEAILSEHGFERVRSLTDSRAALEVYVDFEPDLVLLDLMMPQVDGFTILESIRAERGDFLLPIIVLTADANEKTKLRALAAGASDFLLKPFDQLEALLRIHNLLTARHLQIQLDTQRAALEDALRARDEVAR
jgi:DNA-binding response OmpR family regulator